MRDYQQWHRGYDDPGSVLSWRLARVQDHIRAVLDTRTGALRVLSLCSGDGRDVSDVVSQRADAARLTVTFVELDPDIADQARRRAAAAGLAHAEVRVADAGDTSTYADAVPADLVLLVGILGNITVDDIRATIAAAPQLCAPGATLLWSRGRDQGDLNHDVRRWFAEAGFSELDYQAHESPDGPALGALRYDGPPQPLEPTQLFTFLR
jgi:hypothetical protein